MDIDNSISPEKDAFEYLLLVQDRFTGQRTLPLMLWREEIIYGHVRWQSLMQNTVYGVILFYLHKEIIGPKRPVYYKSFYFLEWTYPSSRPPPFGWVKMSITSDEVNFLVYRYLQESGLFQVELDLQIPHKVLFTVSPIAFMVFHGKYCLWIVSVTVKRILLDAYAGHSTVYRKYMPCIDHESDLPNVLW